MIRRLAAGVALAAMLALPGVGHAATDTWKAQTSAGHEAWCDVTAPYSYCANEYSSSSGELRANVNAGTQVFGKPPFATFVAIFHLTCDQSVTPWRCIPVLATRHKLLTGDVVPAMSACFTAVSPDCRISAIPEIPGEGTFTYEIYYAALLGLHPGDSKPYVIKAHVGYLSA